MSDLTHQLDLTNSNSLKQHWDELTPEKRKEVFTHLTRVEAEDLFLALKSLDQIELLEDIPVPERRSWIRLLPLDDAADYIQQLDPDKRIESLSLLDEHTRHEVMGLLAYAEDDAGGLMNPHYIRLRTEMTVEEAIRYIRAQARTQVENIYYAYVVDSNHCLVGVLSYRELLLSSPLKSVSEIMNTDLIYAHEEMDREEVSRLFAKHDLMSIPVIDAQRKMKGIVTHDDIVDVVQKEATEDIHKIGGMEALDAPYFHVGFFEMLKKRAGWLTILFVGEMFTATAMAGFEGSIQQAVVLALFIPLIISSGGNAGSQASTLVIRALAIQEVRIRDWWKVLYRELGSGLALGLILGTIGFLRVVLWQQASPIYGDHYILIAWTVSLSLIGVVLWGTLSGSMLPFILRFFKLDPASASAPLVATLVDVTGIVLYFSIATLLLKGTLL